MLVTVLLFVLGLICLIKGGDWFVDGATGIAHRFKMPEILIGATVVSIGTTLPEVMVSATAAVSGHSQIAYGNAIGSIICNTALVLAITAAFRPQKIERKGIITPVAFFFVAAAFYVTIAYAKGHFSRLTGALLVVLFVVYMITLTRSAMKSSKAEKKSTGEVNNDAEASEPGETPEATDKKERSFVMEIVLLVVGAALIAVGADLLVDNGTLIAVALGVPESVVALTFVALGTSLPELVTAVTSILKGHGALSLGNVIGANLFNLVLVSGVASALCPFDVPANKMIAGINSSLIIDVPLMVVVMLIATVPTIAKGKISRWQGILLMTIYAAFCVSQFII